MEPTLEQTKALLERAKIVLRKLAEKAEKPAFEQPELFEEAPVMMRDEEEA